MLSGGGESACRSSVASSLSLFHGFILSLDYHRVHGLDIHWVPPFRRLRPSGVIQTQHREWQLGTIPSRHHPPVPAVVGAVLQMPVQELVELLLVLHEVGIEEVHGSTEERDVDETRHAAELVPLVERPIIQLPEVSDGLELGAIVG